MYIERLPKRYSMSDIHMTNKWQHETSIIPLSLIFTVVLQSITYQCRGGKGHFGCTVGAGKKRVQHRKHMVLTQNHFNIATRVI